MPTEFKFFESDGIEEGTVVVCPVCGDHWIHIIRVEVNQNGMLTIVERDNDRLDPDGPREPGQRGSIVTIHYWCERGHGFNHVFQFHKGITYLEMSEPVMGGDKFPRELWRN